MKVLQYNILNGCREPERFKKLDLWMSQQNYDVVGFNEMNDWTSDEFKKHTQKWGYSDSFIFKTSVSRHFVGVCSKSPIRVVELIENPFHHGLLHVVINDVHFLITHLSPQSSVNREKEAIIISDIIKNIKAPLMVMGDLNTLSPLDADHYRKSDLYSALSHDVSLKDKFINNGRINYQPMETLLDAGLIDVGFSETFQWSVPTLINDDKMHAAAMRLDYFLANKSLFDRKPSARIIHNHEVDQLSDHYPIECVWS